MRKREKFHAISSSFKISNGPLSNNANSGTFCLKSPRDWTRWLGSFPPWIGECYMTVWYNIFGGCGSLEHFSTSWTNLDNQWAPMRLSLLLFSPDSSCTLVILTALSDSWVILSTLVSIVDGSPFYQFNGWVLNLSITVLSAQTLVKRKRW